MYGVDWGRGAEKQGKGGPTPSSHSEAARRSRGCGRCNGCVLGDCGACKHCSDKPKFGGRGVTKQACERRTCSAPAQHKMMAANKDEDEEERDEQIEREEREGREEREEREGLSQQYRDACSARAKQRGHSEGGGPQQAEERGEAETHAETRVPLYNRITGKKLVG